MTVNHAKHEGATFYCPGIVRSLLNLLLCFISTSVVAQHTLYLIGDAGEPRVEISPIRKVLEEKIIKERYPTTVLFLGDNIYPKGLPNEDDRHYQESARILQAQIDWVKALAVQAYFIPGNHDWDRGKRKGWERVVNQQQFIDSLKLSHIRFSPRDGCAGPVEVSLTENTTLVIINTQWFLHPWDKPGEASSCEFKTQEEVFTQIHDILLRNKNKRTIIAGHHPIITYGEHGGVYTFKDHLFPLTNLRKSLYIPLPVIGSIYPLYRKFIGNIQDTAHPKYRQFSNRIETMMQEFPGTVYVSGHEHALEYIQKENATFIVSGAGVKTSHVKKKGYAKFARGVKGFVRLEILQDGGEIIEFWQIDDTNPSGKVIWETKLTAAQRQSK